MTAAVVDTFDLASLEAFTAGLVAAGFEPIDNSQRRRWRSGIHPAFAPLTDATTMDLVLVDGWPFEPPALVVKGLDTNHSTLNGLVCLWREDDASLRWITVAGLFERIEEWCHDAQYGWDQLDLGRDARLNFARKAGVVITFDMTAIPMSPGGWGEFHSKVSTAPLRVDITPGHLTGTTLRGLWFHAGGVQVPPRQLSELQRCLSRQQWRGLERAVSRRRSRTALVPSGGVDVVLFCWQRGERLDLLAMALEGVDDTVEAIALVPGPSDEASLILRAGPDAQTLRERTVVLFGAGALGGHVAVTLGESGLGVLDLVDRDILVPGNVVRHVAGHDRVGEPKAEAVAEILRNHAPWTKVTCHLESPMTPDALTTLIEADVVVDATGSAPLTYALATTARSAGKPLVSGALYRGGFVGRVRRQAMSEDTFFEQRDPDHGYPLIPPDEEGEDLATAEIGCSAPVNNAPPSSVLACAALLTHVTIDVLTGRFGLADEVIDVYRPLPDAPPFDCVGRVTFA